jgi:aconitate hydratase
VIAKSFERIHAANLINFGILPLVFARESDYDELMQGSAFKAHMLREIVRGSERVTIDVDGKPLECILSVTARQREILLEGGLLNYTRRRV